MAEIQKLQNIHRINIMKAYNNTYIWATLSKTHDLNGNLFMSISRIKSNIIQTCLFFVLPANDLQMEFVFFG